MDIIPKLSPSKRPAPAELPTDPAESFRYATGGIFGEQGMRIEAEAETDLHGRIGCRLSLSRHPNGKAHEMFLTTEEILSSLLVTSKYLLSAGEPMMHSSEYVPRWIWNSYGVGGLLGSIDTTTTDGADVYAKLMPVYAEAADALQQRSDRMFEVNDTLTQGAKSRAYWLWDIQCLCNPYTGDTRYKFWFQETHPHSPGHGKFYIRYAGRDIMRDMSELAVMLDENLPYLATRYLPTAQEISDLRLRQTLSPIMSPEEPDPQGESPVGKAVEQFIRDECQDPAVDYKQGFWEDRPYWAVPGFQMDGSRHPADYPEVFAYPNTLEVYVARRSQPFGSTTALRAAIAAYLSIRYELETKTDTLRENAVRRTAPWARLPDAGKVWVLPHPEKTAWESSLASEFHSVLVQAGLETETPAAVMPDKISLLLE